MAISTLPISYCANVHPGRTFDETLAALQKYSVPLARRLNHTLAVGLWLPRSVLDEALARPELVQQLRTLLNDNGLVCHTMNAFPFGDFHAERVKEQVYLPDWATNGRSDYTLGCAEILARLLPDGVDGSISTSPMAFKRLHPKIVGTERYFPAIAETARGLAELKMRTGKTIRVAIEPEPLCVLETTQEAIDFISDLRRERFSEAHTVAIAEHVGICYDVCHQAVEFESIADSIAALTKANVRIAKLHITNALELENPLDVSARAELAQFAEPRYLHQTLALDANGRKLSVEDLSPEFALKPPEAWLETSRWRVHFHVPVDRERMGRLRTTRSALKEAFDAVRALPYAPHLEVETYTWGVLADSHERGLDLVEGLHAELLATQDLLEGLAAP